MSYKDKFYSKYVSSHTQNLYGSASLAAMRSQFRILDSYYGKFLPKDRNAKLLDLGCGNGGFVYWLLNSGFEDAGGIDISEEQVKEARNLGIKNILGGDFRKFLKNKKSEYDLISARDILEHFTKEEVIDILDLIYGALKSGGVFIAQTANAENILWGRLRHGDFTHDSAFTKESMKQLLTLTGFREAHIYPQRPVAHGPISSVRFIFWKIFELLLRFYLLVETGEAKGIFTQNILVMAKK